MITPSYAVRYENRGDAPTASLFTLSQRFANGLAQLFLAVVFAISCAPLHADPLLTYPLHIGEHSIRAELANTPRTRSDGLMFRQRLADSSGMIFVFPGEQRVSMWMKNTPIPLSVAFIDANGHILNIENMEPHSERTHSSIKPATYALETNQGWFAARGIRKGDRVTGLERLPPAK
jgi:uncharacterized membrane protein (UPF0127 family)